MGKLTIATPEKPTQDKRGELSLSRVRYVRKGPNQWAVIRETVTAAPKTEEITVSSLRGAKLEVRRLIEEEFMIRSEKEAW